MGVKMTKMDDEKDYEYVGTKEDGEDNYINKFDLTKEYCILSYYNNYGIKKRIMKLLNLLNNAIETDQVGILNLEVIKNNIDFYFQFLLLNNKFENIQNKSPYSISYDYFGFHVNSFTFETLDEVQRALENKMFL